MGLVLDVLAQNWRHQLIGIATDGASTMTGSVKGTCTRLSKEYGVGRTKLIL